MALNANEGDGTKTYLVVARPEGASTYEDALSDGGLIKLGPSLARLKHVRNVYLEVNFFRIK
jgi:hypothetical protein